MSKTIVHGIKDLKISAPQAVDQSPSKLKCKVILVAKFDFNAESDHELSVKKGDVLKLVDRLSNGWVVVEFIDKIVTPGLVPSLYVDIAVNDPIHPITLRWLHEKAGSKPCNTFYDVQVSMLLESNAPMTINNCPYPLAVSVSCYLMYENRFWYRVDVTYSTGEQGYLCRYYSDFYNLHLALLDYVAAVEKSENTDSLSKLPKLPEPVPSSGRTSGEQTTLFSNRCRDLTAYMHTLISDKHYRVCPTLIEWLTESYNDLPGLVVEEPLKDYSEAISQRILPGSVMLASKNKIPLFSEAQSDSKAADSGKYFVPSRAGTTKSKNTYNHYQQAANAMVNIGRSSSTTEKGLGRSKSVSASTVSSVGRSKTISSTRQPGSMPPTPKLYGMQQSPRTPASNFPTPKSASSKFTPETKYTPERNEPSAFGTPSKVPSNAPVKSHPTVVQTGMHTPKSNSRTSRPKQVVCKIKTQNNDEVLIRLDGSEIVSLEELKRQIYRKIAFNSMFIKFPEEDSYEEIDPAEHEVMSLIAQQQRLFLLLT